MNLVQSFALRRVSPLAILIGLLFTFGLQRAQAARDFFDSTPQPLSGTCPVTGNIVVVSQNQVGYFTDPNEPYPKTGDVVYVRAMSTNVSPCLNDTVGFDFFFPVNTVLAVDSTNRVRCYRVRLSNGQTEEFTSDSNGACLQAPTVGTFGGHFFGWSAVAPGWRLEIRVPVRFNQQLLGLGGPNTHKLQAVARTVYGNAVPELLVTSYYEADFAALTSTGITTSSAKVNADLFSYHKSGVAYFDYGTTGSFGQSISVGTIADAQVGYGIFADLTGLSAGTTYHWRSRYVTASGTFTSPPQTFTTGSAQNFTLTVNKTGTGTGTLTSNPAGINCGSTCSANFAQGTSVTLIATPASGSTFAGWSGACSGTGSCTVSMDAAKSVSAVFNTTNQAGSLALTVNGLPVGSSSTLTITGPGGFSTTRTLGTGTGQTLSDVTVGSYTVAAPNVTVGSSTYLPNAASQTANVALGTTATVNVVYTLATSPTYTLTVTKTGTGTGTVTSHPVGLNCGNTCNTNFIQNTVVSLTATAASGSTFDGWGGACTGTGSCNVTMSAAKSVTASFNLAPTGTFALTINKNGTGQGTVTSTPSGIECGATCSASFGTGSSVRLNVTLASGSSFAGWSGACSGVSSCTVPMTADQSVTATFQTDAATTQLSAKATNFPSNTNALTGDSTIPALGFLLSGEADLTSLTLAATGTGNDALDLSNLKLILDSNNNGKVDEGEPVLAQGKFAADDAETTLTLTSPQTLRGSSQFVIAVDINNTLVGLGALPVLALTGFTGLGGLVRRKRVRALLLVVVVPLLLAASCGGDPPAQVRTYQLSLSSVSATTSSGSSAAVTGLPIQGTTLNLKP